ncbi:hypothetical protein ABW19_dt0204102 [Dactylella cylindrospora]|nr:hypothetical protein ABW19_dt0204102 [Dactylella cylindrospora]
MADSTAPNDALAPEIPSETRSNLQKFMKAAEEEIKRRNAQRALARQQRRAQWEANVIAANERDEEWIDNVSENPYADDPEPKTFTQNVVARLRGDPEPVLAPEPDSVMIKVSDIPVMKGVFRSKDEPKPISSEEERNNVKPIVFSDSSDEEQVVENPNEASESANLQMSSALVSNTQTTNIQQTNPEAMTSQINPQGITSQVNPQSIISQVNRPPTSQSASQGVSRSRKIPTAEARRAVEALLYGDPSEADTEDESAVRPTFNRGVQRQPVPGTRSRGTGITNTAINTANQAAPGQDMLSSGVSSQNTRSQGNANLNASGGRGQSTQSEVERAVDSVLYGSSDEGINSEAEEEVSPEGRPRYGRVDYGRSQPVAVPEQLLEPNRDEERRRILAEAAELELDNPENYVTDVASRLNEVARSEGNLGTTRNYVFYLDSQAKEAMKARQSQGLSTGSLPGQPSGQLSGQLPNQPSGQSDIQPSGQPSSQVPDLLGSNLAESVYVPAQDIFSSGQNNQGANNAISQSEPSSGSVNSNVNANVEQPEVIFYDDGGISPLEPDIVNEYTRSNVANANPSEEFVYEGGLAPMQAETIENNPTSTQQTGINLFSSGNANQGQDNQQS